MATMAELYYNEKSGEWAFRQKRRSPKKNAKEIWLGHIRPGGSLESILKATPGQIPTNLP